MYGVVVRVSVNDVAAGRQMLDEQVIPRVKLESGFMGGIWLAPDADGVGLSVALFETEEDARALEVKVPPGAPVELVSIEVREVFAQV